MEQLLIGSSSRRRSVLPLGGDGAADGKQGLKVGIGSAAVLVGSRIRLV